MSAGFQGHVHSCGAPVGLPRGQQDIYTSYAARPALTGPALTDFCAEFAKLAKLAELAKLATISEISKISGISKISEI